MQYKQHKIPIYQQTLHIIISENVKKEIKQINKKFYTDLDRFDFAGYSMRTGKHHLVLLNKKYLKDEVFLMGTISHEAFHISNFIMKRVGIHPDVNNDEAQAYLLSWITEKVYRLWKTK